MPKQPANSLPIFDPANFVDGDNNPFEVNNLFFPLEPGTTFTYESRSPDGSLLELW